MSAPQIPLNGLGGLVTYANMAFLACFPHDLDGQVFPVQVTKFHTA